VSIDLRVPLADRRSARARFTERTDGDLRITLDAAQLGPRRRVVADLRWAWLHQVHGAGVVVVDDAGVVPEGVDADALVTSVGNVALAVHTADCAPVWLVDDRAGVIGVVHAGWRGLRAGVLPATVEAMGVLGADSVRATLGPCIRAECYQFAPEDLADLVDVFGPSVAAHTAAGDPAFDVAAAVRVALGRLDVVVDDLGLCTACTGERFFSHRARSDQGRQAVVAWIEAST
jgi:YfiH family protein